MLRAIPNRLSALWTRFRQEPATDRREREVIGKGHSLLRLHEYQHRVIIEIFRISITGTLVFSFVLIGFSLYSLLDPYAPSWMAVLTALIAVSLCAALVRTVQEFRTYRSNYQEISAILQSKLVKQTVKGTVATSSGEGLENRLLTSLKPREHKGWDAKTCRHCNKSIDMMTSVCQHCGQEQNDVLGN